jgi:hypothetical protein
LLDASQNNLGLVPEAVGGLAHLIVEMGHALAAKVLQFHSFQVVPDSLGGVQLWRVARQLLQVHPVGGTVTQILLDYPAPVDGRL